MKKKRVLSRRKKKRLKRIKCLYSRPTVSNTATTAEVNIVPERKPAHSGIPGQGSRCPRLLARGVTTCFLSAVSKTPCEKLISKGSLSLGSSASLLGQTGSKDNTPVLSTKILYPGKKAQMEFSLYE